MEKHTGRHVEQIRDKNVIFFLICQVQVIEQGGELYDFARVIAITGQSGNIFIETDHVKAFNLVRQWPPAPQQALPLLVESQPLSIGFKLDALT